MQITHCSLSDHGAAILEIFNDAIAHTTALYEYQPRTAEYITSWFTEKQSAGQPILGALDQDGTLLGFATFGPYRPRAAYKYTIEHSVYVHPQHRGRGVGRALMEHIIQLAQQRHHQTSCLQIRALARFVVLSAHFADASRSH